MKRDHIAFTDSLEDYDLALINGYPLLEWIHERILVYWQYQSQLENAILEDPNLLVWNAEMFASNTFKGNYAANSPVMIYNDMMQFIYNKAQQGKGKLLLFFCECGEVGCWSIWAIVQVKDDVVEWLCYEGYGEKKDEFQLIPMFTFDRDQFFSAFRYKNFIKLDSLGEIL